MTRMHKNSRVNCDKCDKCEKSFKDEIEVNKHYEIEHAETVSPEAKKRKHDKAVGEILQNDGEVIENKTSTDFDKDIEDCITLEEEVILDDKLKVELELLEGKSWEEKRMSDREIEIQVNEEELERMEDYEEEERNQKEIRKLSNKQMKS
jgi:hypothetical protein